jgi:hypothetical protein
MGQLLKIQCVDSRVNVYILASTSVPFSLKTVQVPNFALTNTKQITVCAAPGRIYITTEACDLHLDTRLNNFENTFEHFICSLCWFTRRKK